MVGMDRRTGLEISGIDPLEESTKTMPAFLKRKHLGAQVC